MESRKSDRLFLWMKIKDLHCSTFLWYKSTMYCTPDSEFTSQILSILFEIGDLVLQSLVPTFYSCHSPPRNIANETGSQLLDLTRNTSFSDQSCRFHFPLQMKKGNVRVVDEVMVRMPDDLHYSAGGTTSLTVGQGAKMGREQIGSFWYTESNVYD